MAKRILFLFTVLCFIVPQFAQSQKSTPLVDSLRAVLNSTTTPEARMDALADLARKISSDDPEGAKKLVEQLMAMGKETDDRAKVAVGHNIMGSVYFYQGEYDEALVEWQHAYSIYSSLDSLDARSPHALALASALNNMGIVHKHQGNLPEALELYYAALKVREELGDPYTIGSSYLNIGGLYKAQNRPDEAVLFFLKAKNLFEEAEDVYGQAAVLNNLGNIYEQQKGGLEKAYQAYTEALALFEEVENERGIGMGLNNLGIILQMRGECTEALEFLERAKTIRESSGDKAGVASVLQNIALCHAKIGETELAIQEYERSLALAAEDRMVRHLMEGHKAIASVLAEEGQYAAAYQHQLQFQQLRDSIFDKENNEKLANIEERYSRFKQSKASMELDNRLVQQSASLDLSRKIMFALIISLIVIIGLLVVVVARYRVTRKLTDKLEERNLEVAMTNRHLKETQVSKEEKEELLKEIHHRVKNNLQIITSLLRFQSDMVKEPEVVALFQECQERIVSMSLLHEQLYRNEDLSFVDVSAYLHSLLGGLRASYAKNKDIQMDIAIGIDRFGVNTMIPLGLVINEIASNSFKHGFNGKTKGAIQLRLSKKDSNTYELYLSDDGVGISDSVDFEEPMTLGLELIKIFVDQLDGQVELKNHVGTAYHIIFQEQKETIKHVAH